MSEREVLYVRRNNISSSQSENEDIKQNTWDDLKLKKAYDKATNIDNIEVAKRIAMSTNTNTNGSAKKSPLNQAPPRSKKESKTKWKPGMHCRALYENGIEYEGFILRAVSDTECVVRFVGYENPEVVPISSLKRSAGKRERNKQIEEALGDDGLSNHSHTVEEMDCSNQAQAPASSKKNKATSTYGFTLRDLPSMDVPSFAQLKNMAAMETPTLPPPPLSMPRQDTESDDEAMSSMLVSWFMSGYYTGLYQRAQEENKKEYTYRRGKDNVRK